MLKETSQIDYASLQSELAGEVVTPVDEGWDGARQAWNLAVDQRPEAVAIPASAEDVAATVRFAAANGLRVAPQGTGHNARPFGDLTGTILMRMQRLDEIEVDAENRRARVGAGVLWGAVTPLTSEHGLAPLSGSSIDVGVVGYTLGGGLSWLGRKHGLAANHVISIEAVLADGRTVRADRDSEPDLFWALRGGGGSFAAVTAIEFELFPVDALYAGMLAFPWERAAEVLEAWRQWLPSTPDEATTVGRIMQFPPFEEVPEMVRGRQMVIFEMAYLGDEQSGAELIAPLRELGPEIDTFAAVPPAALSHLHMDPEHPVPGFGDHRMLGDLSAEAIETLVDVAGAESGSPLLSVELRQLGGALARDEEGCALPALDGSFAMFGVGIAADPEMMTATSGHVAKVKAAMEPWDAGRFYSNFTEEDGDCARFFRENDYRRLRQVKAAYDPGDLFRANHQIPPAD
jgi:FAD/FMN-containing dehydrogenase